MDGIIAGALHLKRGPFRLAAEFSAPAQGVTIVAGPSGSGKTTFFRALAGLDKARGSLEVLGEQWQSPTHFLAPYRRRVGFVFQEASLLVHLSVEENLRFAYPKEPVQRRISWDSVIKALKLDALLSRDPSSLSGGEKQRVAIGRALLSQPLLLLMDEPLNGLDYSSKLELLPYLEDLNLQFGLPIFYATHSIDEMIRLGHHLLLMDGGLIVKSESLERIKPRLKEIQAIEEAVGIYFRT